MDDCLYKLLETINTSGYKAYIVGGYVRDSILGFDNKDIDVVTNTPVNMLLSLFSLYKPKELKNNTITFKYFEYNIDITQMRSEVFNGKYTDIQHTSDLKLDYLRRDFTFNAIYIDKNLNYTDFDNCINDLKNKKLRFIGDPYIKCKEDPTRLIRGIYFILKYDLNEYDCIFSFKLTNDDIKNIDVNSLNKQIIKILKLNKNSEFIYFLEKCGIYNYLFKNKDKNYDVKPMDFLNNNGYIYYDSFCSNK